MKREDTQTQQLIPTVGGDEDLTHPSIGLKCDRSCTDCWCLFVFAACWVVLIILAATVFSKGDPDRLLYGTDYMGNVCAKGSPDVDAGNWSLRKLLWYPVTYDPNQRKLILTEAIDLGVCVETCPKRSDLLVTVYQSTNDSSTHQRWPVLFDSSDQAYRCIPDFLTFDCGNVSSCMGSLAGAAESFGQSSGIAEMGMAAFVEVTAGWWIILLSAIGSVVIALIWLFFLRYTVKPLVVLLILLLLVTMIGLGVLFFLKRKQVLDDPQSAGSDAPKMWLAMAIVAWCSAFIFLCVIIFLGKSIMIACDIIEEAAKVPISIPTMNLVPPVLFLCILPFIALFVAVAIFIQSTGDVISLSVTIPTYNSTADFSNVTSLITGQGVTTISTETKDFEFEGWRVYAHVFNLMMMLWNFGFLNAICYLIFAFCGVFWYWSRPGGSKSPPIGSVCIATKKCLRYHMGTLALGSFIVAVVQVMRILLVFIERKAKESGVASNKAVEFLFKCLHCFLACLERVIKFVNKNAYIVQAHNGKSFIPAAREGIELLGGNVLSVGATQVIGEVFIICGKVQITVLSAALAFLLTQASGQASEGISKGVLIIVIAAVFGFLIATLFMFVLSACIDTILMCFCYDRVHSDVDYFPPDLAQHLDLNKDADKAKGKVDLLEKAHEMTSKDSPPHDL